jgi:hypothetical protein
VGLAAIAAVVAVALVLRDDPSGANGGAGDGGGGGGSAIRLVGVASYDPEGDDRVEHPERVGDATDGNRATYWTTSEYQDFHALKSGVGLVLDGGEPIEPEEVRVTTETPGFTAEIRAGAAATGPFRRVSPSMQVNGTTVFRLDSDPARYYVVWITDLDRVAHVNEVVARS